MTSIREVLRRLLSREPAEEGGPSDFAYTIYWTKNVREWSSDRRQEVLLAVERVVCATGFVPTVFQRRYTVTEVDDGPHSGVSLLALLKVLESFVLNGAYERDE